MAQELNGYQHPNVPATPETFKAASGIHAAQYALTIANRIKDPDMRRKALREMWKWQKKFHAEYQKKFPQSVGRAGNGMGASSGAHSADWCKAFGFSQRSVQRWGEGLNREIEDAILDTWLRQGTLDARGNTIATKWTGDAESYTPKIYIDAAREVMGGIDLDPASNSMAQQIVRASKWFDANDDGLAQQWAGRVFLNPPYAQPIVAHFIEKLCTSLETVTQAVLLTNNNTDTRWWHSSARQAAAICFTAGRINFYKADGTETQPTNGQTFFYFGDRHARFGKVFGKFGTVMVCQ